MHSLSADFHHEFTAFAIKNGEIVTLLIDIEGRIVEIPAFTSMSYALDRSGSGVDPRTIYGRMKYS